MNSVFPFYTKINYLQIMLRAKDSTQLSRTVTYDEVI